MGAAFSCQGTLPNQTHHYATGKEFYGEKSHLLPWKLSAISQLLCIFLSNFFVFQYLTNLLCSQYTELWLLLLGLWQLPWECQQEICFQLDIMRKMKFAGTEMCVVPCSALVLLWESCLISLRFNFLLYKVGVVIITLTFGVVSRIQENIFENVIYKLFIIWQMLDFTFSVRACGNTVSQTTYCFSGLHPYVSIFHPHQHELGPFQMIPAQKRPGLVKLPGTCWHRPGCPALQISNVGAASASHPQEMRKEGPAPQHTVNTWHTFLE